MSFSECTNMYQIYYNTYIHNAEEILMDHQKLQKKKQKF